MNIEQVRESCLTIHAGVEECSPFEGLGYPDIAFKIAGKIFAYLCVPGSPSCSRSDSVNLLVVKSDPDEAMELREKYPGIIEPAWHWNKKHWNQVSFRGLLTDDLILSLIRHSYNEVAKKLPKRILASNPEIAVVE